MSAAGPDARRCRSRATWSGSRSAPARLIGRPWRSTSRRRTARSRRCRRPRARPGRRRGPSVAQPVADDPGEPAGHRVRRTSATTSRMPGDAGLVHDEPVEVGLGLDERQVRVDRRGDQRRVPRGRCAMAGRDAPSTIRAATPPTASQSCGLVGEVAVEHRLADPGARGDRVHADLGPVARGSAAIAAATSSSRRCSRWSAQRRRRPSSALDAADFDRAFMIPVVTVTSGNVNDPGGRHDDHDSRTRPPPGCCTRRAEHSYDPDVEIDWDAPLARTAASRPPHRCTLYGTPLWDAAHRGAADRADQARGGQRRQRRHLVRDDPHADADPRRTTTRTRRSRHAQYALTEIADECRHSVMFAPDDREVRRARRTGRAPSTTASAGAQGDRDAAVHDVRRDPIAEEILDALQREPMADEQRAAARPDGVADPRGRGGPAHPLRPRGARPPGRAGRHRRGSRTPDW